MFGPILKFIYLYLYTENRWQQILKTLLYYNISYKNQLAYIIPVREPKKGKWALIFLMFSWNRSGFLVYFLCFQFLFFLSLYLPLAKCSEESLHILTVCKLPKYGKKIINQKVPRIINVEWKERAWLRNKQANMKNLDKLWKCQILLRLFTWTTFFLLKASAKKRRENVTWFSSLKFLPLNRVGQEKT